MELGTFCWAVLLVFIWVVVIVQLINEHVPRNTEMKITVPAPVHLDKEQEFISRIKQIKALVEKGKYDKAIVLLKKLEVLDSISSNTTPVNSGELKE